jgi:hypothetical protein
MAPTLLSRTALIDRKYVYLHISNAHHLAVKFCQSSCLSILCVVYLRTLSVARIVDYISSEPKRTVK